MVWEVMLCGSSKLVGDAAQPRHPRLKVPVARFWLKHWGEGDLHRGWITAHDRALGGSIPLEPLDLSDEGLTLPFGSWGHSVSLGHLNTEGPAPLELRMATSLAPLGYLTSGQNSLLSSENQQFEPAFLRTV